jgi:hypothetical protein
VEVSLELLKWRFEPILGPEPIRWPRILAFRASIHTSDPVDQNHACPLGTLGARGASSLRSVFNVRGGRAAAAASRLILIFVDLGALIR